MKSELEKRVEELEKRLAVLEGSPKDSLRLSGKDTLIFSSKLYEGYSVIQEFEHPYVVNNADYSENSDCLDPEDDMWRKVMRECIIHLAKKAGILES